MVRPWSQIYLIPRPDLHSVPLEDPSMTPIDFDSDSGSESASAYAPEGNDTTNQEAPRPLSTSSQSYTFHPRKLHTLLVGTSSNDGKDAWLSLIKYHGKLNSYRSTFYDRRGILHTEDQLNILWHDEFKYSRFPLHSQKQTQRRHIYEILEKHEVHVTEQGRESGQVRKDGATRLPRRAVSGSTPRAALDVESSINTTNSKRRQSSRRKSPAMPTNVSGESSDEDRPIIRAKRCRRTTMPLDPVATFDHKSSSEVEVLSTRTRPGPTDERTSTTTPNVLSPSEIAATTFLVSASNQHGLAPVHVPLRECSTHKKLFKTLDTLFEEFVTTGYSKGKTASDFDMVSAECVWIGPSQLMRRGNDGDWDIFLRTLEKAWKRTSQILEQDGCKISLLVHCKG